LPFTFLPSGSILCPRAEESPDAIEEGNVLRPIVGFIVYGVHKDGLKDPMGRPFIDEAVVAASKKALRDGGIELVEHPIVVATKAEAREALARMKKDDAIDAVVLFSGTWVWAAHLVGAVRDFAMCGKGLVLWTHPGSRGWRPVGGLVVHGALMEVGIAHRFVYGAASDPAEVGKIASYCEASRLRRSLSMSTIGAFGGRGMGQTCGAADPSQWMKTFGIDIDSRDTTELIRRAGEIPASMIAELEPRFDALFGARPEASAANERSIRLYLALKELVAENDFDFYTIQSFPGLANDYAASCFAQSMMLEDGRGTSTLGDFNTALTVFLLTSLSGERVYYGDLQHIDKAKREIKIIGDGAVPPSLAGKAGPARFAEHGIPTEGEAGGLSVRLVCKPGEGVLARLGRLDGKFRMVIAACEAFEPSPAELERRLEECGIPFWPHGFVRVRGDVERLIQEWGNEYACLGYGGRLLPALLDFCELTGIEAIVP
jgi:L-fucose isomerase-like protein